MQHSEAELKESKGEEDVGLKIESKLAPLYNVRVKQESPDTFPPKTLGPL